LPRRQAKPGLTFYCAVRAERHMTALIYIMLVSILGFFFLKDGPEFRNSILEVLAEGS
jgi:predicted PurR-regulated permease PerM